MKKIIRSLLFVLLFIATPDVYSNETALSAEITAQSLKRIIKKLTGILPVTINNQNHYIKSRYARFDSLVGLPPLAGIIATQTFIVNYLHDNGLEGNVVIEDDNVIVTIPGKVNTRLIVGAHYDSVNGSPGANDNGSGVAALLELARLMADESPHHTLQLLFFGRHEYYPMSSYDFVENLNTEQRKNILSFLSLDIIAELKSPIETTPLLLVNCKEEQALLEFPSNLKDNLTAGVMDYHFTDSCKRDYSDHGIFFKNGIPAFHLTVNGRDHYHTSDDTYDKWDYNRLKDLSTDLLESIKLFLIN